jgi:hypothetical protein
MSNPAAAVAAAGVKGALHISGRGAGKKAAAWCRGSSGKKMNAVTFSILHKLNI